MIAGSLIQQRPWTAMGKCPQNQTPQNLIQGMSRCCFTGFSVGPHSSSGVVISFSSRRSQSAFAPNDRNKYLSMLGGKNLPREHRC